MAKTLGKLRQQTLKLRDLQAPADTTPATKAFVRKHVYAVHPDANGNEDDVFKASNIKRSKRFPEHGYEPGMDQDVYEDTDSELHTPEYHRGRAHAFQQHANLLAANRRELGNAENEKIYRGLARDERERAKKARKLQKKAPDVAGESVIEGYDDIDTDRKEARRLFAKAARKRNYAANLKDDHRSSRVALGHKFDQEADQHEKDAHELLKRSAHVEETDLEEVMVPSMPAIYSALSRSSRTARNPSSRRPAPRDPTYWKGTLELTPDMQDPEQRKQMAAFNDKIGRLAAHRKQFGENSEAVGYEHIEALSESDQDLLIDTYNILSEENQEKFLVIAETPEGVDQLLDFAINNQTEVK